MFTKTGNRSLIAGLSLLSLVACAPQLAWVKPGATQQDFATAQYSCLQSVTASAPAVAGIFGTSSSSGTALQYQSGAKIGTQDINQGQRNQLFTACMQSQGWTLQRVSTAEDTKAVSDRLELCGKEVMDSPDFDPIRDKWPNDLRKATLAQLTDDTKATREQVTAIKTTYPRFQTCREVAMESLSKANPVLAQKLTKIWTDVEAVTADLVEGKISWGEATKRKRRLYAAQG